MTHFAVAVIVPPRIFKRKRVKEYLFPIMEKFLENYEYPKPRRFKVNETTLREIAEFNNIDLADPKSNLRKLPPLIRDWFSAKRAGARKGGFYFWTTENQDAHLDWWRVGGRFDGCIVGKPQSSQNGFNFDDKHETVKNNSMLMRRIKPEFKISHFITPDGKWHDEFLTTVCERYKNHYAVICDCHQ